MINCFLNVPLMLISIIANPLILVAIVRTPSLRSPSTVFLCSLAVSDLLVGLVVQPVYIAYELKRGPVLLRAFSTLFGIACGVSLCTMTVISLDRFLALHYHMRYPNLMTEKRALYTSAAIWSGCIFVSCLSLWYKSYAALAISTAVCLVISFFSYIRIYLIVCQHQQQIQAQQQAVHGLNAEHNPNMVQSKRSAVNTFIYYICMILCYTPFVVLMLITAFNPTFRRNSWDFKETCTFVNSSINPFLFCWRLRELRNAVLKTLRQFLGKQTQGN